MTQTINSRETEKGRVYDWKSHTYPSVTQIIKDGLAKPGLITWAAKSVAKEAADNAEFLAGLKTKKARQDFLMDRFSGSRNSGRAVIGTVVHGHADSIAKGDDMSTVIYPDEVLPFMDSFNSFLADWNPFYMESEAFVFSATYGYAGTLDSIVKMDGQIYVLDIKTGASIWPEVGLQLAAYSRADAIGRKGGIEDPLPSLNVKKGLVLHLREDGYELRDVRIDDEVFDSFLACLDMYHYQTSTRFYIIGNRWEKE